MKSTIKLFVAICVAFCILSCKTPRANVKTAADMYGRDLHQYMRVTLTDDSGRADEIIIGLKDKASIDFEIDEDRLYNHLNSGIGLCSLSGDGVPLTINVMPLPGIQPEVVRLNVSAFQNKKLKLQMTGMAGLSHNFKVKLIDRFENASSEFVENSTYIFNSGKGHNSRADAARFILVIYQQQYYSFYPGKFYNKRI
jgi:hypothetical protein